MTTVIEAISHWCETNSSFPEPTRKLGREAIADTIAGMVAGRADPSTLTLRKAAAARIGSTGSRVIGGGRADPAQAALINGTAAHALDYDDNFRPGMSHASAVIVPALLAIADQRGSSGADLVTAYLIGLQAQAFVGWGVGYSHYVAGWHGTSTIGSIGTAAGTAWLAGEGRDGIARALTVGVSLASGVKGQFGTMVKPFHAGLAARNAVEAAELAGAGLVGRLDILEGEQGFRELYGGAYPENWWNAGTILGTSEHVIVTTGLMPKRHPCCGSTHPVVDALLDLQTEHGFSADQVAKVETLVGIANWRNLAYPRPVDEMQARFSMQYCVAQVLRKGRLELADFTPAAVAAHGDDPLLGVVSMEHYSEEVERKQPRMPHEVVLTLTSGEVLKASRASARGSLGDPFSDEDRRLKFIDCCAPVLGDSAEAMFRRCEALDDEPDLGLLDPLFAAE